mgnify:CR=1 FL=1
MTSRMRYLRVLEILEVALLIYYIKNFKITLTNPLLSGCGRGDLGNFCSSVSASILENLQGSLLHFEQIKEN